jgi:hypothetical protein
MIWDRHFDVRLRAFLIALAIAFPYLKLVITDMRRRRGTKPSGHSNLILCAVDIRSKNLTIEQIIKIKNWYDYWWADKPDLIDLVIEDGRFDPKYIKRDKDGNELPFGQQPWHVHVEIAEIKYWR